MRAASAMLACFVALLGCSRDDRKAIAAAPALPPSAFVAQALRGPDDLPTTELEAQLRAGPPAAQLAALRVLSARQEGAEVIEALLARGDLDPIVRLNALAALARMESPRAQLALERYQHGPATAAEREQIAAIQAHYAAQPPAEKR